MSCSVIVIDCNANSWGCISEKWKSEEVMKKTIASTILLTNSHLFSSAGNRVIVVAAGSPIRHKVLFNSEALPKDVSAADEIDRNVRKAIQASARSNEDGAFTNYSASFALAVCQFYRFKRETCRSNGQIIVVNLSSESYGEQAKLMNLFLGAQQQNLKIHICSFEVTNPMLRQASDVTGGVHKEIHNVDDVPDFFTRYCLGGNKDAQEAFANRNFEKIDYQASCYCHHKAISLGFVCSVCLAVHCHYVPICVACGTAFKVSKKK